MQEVEALVKCHEENPFMKFLNACGDAKVAMDRCFRVCSCTCQCGMAQWWQSIVPLCGRVQEEKKLRVKLNKRIEPMYPLKPVHKSDVGTGSETGAGAGAGAGTAS